MKVKVVALPEIREYFKELIHILHEKEYFGFEENAIEYVESLFEDIKTTLPQRSKNKLLHIFPGMEKICIIHLSKRIKRLNGMSFSRSI